MEPMPFVEISRAVCSTTGFAAEKEDGIHGIKDNRRHSKSKSSNFVRLERDYLLFLLLGDGAFVGNWYGFYSVLSVWVLCDDTSETLLQLLTGLVTFLLCAGRLRVKLMLL